MQRSWLWCRWQMASVKGLGQGRGQGKVGRHIPPGLSIRFRPRPTGLPSTTVSTVTVRGAMTVTPYRDEEPILRWRRPLSRGGRVGQGGKYHTYCRICRRLPRSIGGLFLAAEEWNAGAVFAANSRHHEPAQALQQREHS